MKFAGGLPDEKIRKGCDFAAEPFDWINNMDPIKPLGRIMGEIFSSDCSVMSSPGGHGHRKMVSFSTINEILIPNPHLCYFVNTVIAPG